MTANEVMELIGVELLQATSTANVGVKEFKTLDDAVAKLTEADDRQEFKNYCEESLSEKDRNSIALRYLATITGRHPMDDRHIFTVLEQYYEASRWDEVIFLGNKILTFNESSYALKALAECYSVNNMTEKKIETWERLVKVDFEETEVLYKLADYFGKKGDTSAAMTYYRSIIRRHIKANDLTALKNVWGKVMTLKGDNSDFLIGLASKIADAMGSDKGVFFLNDIYENGNFELDTKIDILKKIIHYGQHDSKTARDRLVALWKEKYRDNPRLSYCLENTGILNEYMNPSTAVENFEKQIQFVEGAFVYHETWKLGRIRSISKDEMVILFAGKGEHTMSCKMAFSSLRVLPKRHIWVLKAAVKKETLADKFLNDTEWGLKVLLGSFSNEASIKQMKTELVPSILTDKQWSTWQSAAKNILSTNEYFGVSENSVDVYVLRTTPITFEEKTLAIFKATNDFYEKLRIMKDFINHKGQTDSDEFMIMVSYFQAKAQSSGTDGCVAYLVLEDLKNKKGMGFAQTGGTFIEYYNRIGDKKRFFNNIQDTELKRSFVEAVMDNDEKWQEVLIDLYPYYMTGFMSECIRKGSKKNALFTVLKDSEEHCRENPDFFLYLERTFSAKDWAKAKVGSEELLITKLNLLSFVNRKIENSSDVADNKKRQKILMTNLFSEPDREVYRYLDNADADQAQKLFSILRGLSGIETERLTVKHYIAQRFEDWEAITGENPNKAIDRKKIIPKGLLCTKTMFEAKSAELDHIMNVEIPENSKEIGSARELGDLRENAEYQYGKDKQKNLNFLMNKLTDELEVAQIIHPEKVDTKYVSFGTKVTFHDNSTDEDVVYTLLGPWESDPNKNILNFKAPLGQAIYNMEVNETRKFEINGVSYDYTVIRIELADF